MVALITRSEKADIIETYKFFLMIPDKIIIIPSTNNIIVSSLTLGISLLINKDITSVPPVAAPQFNAKNIDTPTNNPPTIAHTIIEEDNKYSGTIFIKAEFNKIKAIVLILNLLPKTIVAIIKRGIEIHKLIIEVDKGTIWDITIARPVIPPGAKPYVIKFIFTAIAMHKDEIIILIIVFIVCIFFQQYL